MFSLAGDAFEWYHSLPSASIPSLREFHAVFNRNCKRYYPSQLICHNCCEECEDSDQYMAMPNEDHEEEGYSLGELMGMVKSLSTEIERSKSEEDVEDFPFPEVDDLDNPIYDDSIEYFIMV